ncbi:HutD family protein [Alcaligenes faecalis]|uniref:Histidine utilization protein HutD n=1 Tax=Alcaligenes faecalis TaxID=511 RepID=A0AB33D4Y5_ALCFA|nr:HutD family protein [Alcaligenes faecalis]ASR91127.1 histidine utilization protein HutD [Alcaligenes faecalis]
MSDPHPATLLDLLNISSLPAQPWKNGGGTTHEIRCSPKNSDYEHFDWRISLAQVHTSGDFSRFPGIDRHIMLIKGDNMQLTHHDHIHVLHPFQPYAFAGEDRVACMLPLGPTQDLNLMLRRGRAQGSLQAWQGRNAPMTLAAGTHFLYAPQGGYQLQADIHRWTLNTGQALTGSTSAPLSLQLQAEHADAPLVYAYIAPTE